MKKIFYLVLLVIISCNKNNEESIPDAPEMIEDPIEQGSEDEPNNDEPITNNFGIIEEFIGQDSEIKVEPISIVNSNYQSNAATKRGYFFKPSVDIEITALGGLMAKTGEYEIELYEFFEDAIVVEDVDPILKHMVSITETEEFQFSELENKIVLQANKSYILRYFDINHESVYDVVLPDSYNINQTYHPQTIKIIEFQKAHFAYYNFREILGEYQLSSEGTFEGSNLFLRGIPDFKYQIKE